MPKCRTLCLYLLIPVAISVVMLLFLQVPSYSGVHIAASGKYNAITIHRDAHGVPTVVSKTFQDTLYGLGYAHAQDRLWTMNFRKLLVAGRLGEVFGSEGLVFDRFFRNLSLKRYCVNATDYLDDEAREDFQAYIDGINEYIRTVKVLPLPFWITYTNVEPFTIADAVANAKFLSFFLALDFPFEFIFETLEELVGTERASEIIPHTSDKFLWADKVILNDDELKQTGIFEAFNGTRLYTETSELDPILPERMPFAPISKDSTIDTTKGPNKSNGHLKNDDQKGKIGQKLGEEVVNTKTQSQLGSNVWAIHGNHTTTGKPILASDPHLLNTMPSFWYNCELVFEGDHHISGMSFPGLPGVIIGKTQHVAWGVTNLFADTSDIFTIETKGENYLYENEWRPMRVIHENIKIRGKAEPELLIIYESHHGVVVDHHLAFPFAGMTFSPMENKTHVLSWIGYSYSKPAIEPVLKIPDIKTTEEVLNVWKSNIEPSLSLVFATSAGDIGYLSLGKIPVRRSVSDGRKPRDGSKKENDWLGFVPWKDQPRVINPAKGYIVSANNKISTDNIKWSLSTNLMPTSRATRIDEMLRDYIDKGKKLSVDITKKMQMDSLDIVAREFVPIIDDNLREALEENVMVKDLKVSKKDLTSLLDQMKKWDFRMEADSVGAGIFGVWQTFFLRKVLKTVGLSDEDRGAIIGNFKIDHFIFRKLILMYRDKAQTKYDDYFCHDTTHDDFNHPCIFILLKALEETWLYFNQKIGPDVSGWKWGKVHTMEYPMPPFDMSPLKKLFQRSVESPGNSRTVFVSGLQPNKDNFEGIWSPNTRMVASMKEGDKSFFVIDTGVSDNIMSKHYDDQMKLYYKNEYIEMNEQAPKASHTTLEIRFGEEK